MGSPVYGEHRDQEQPVTTYSQAGDTWGCLGVDERTDTEIKRDIEKIRKGKAEGLVFLIGGTTLVLGIGCGLYSLFKYFIK